MLIRNLKDKELTKANVLFFQINRKLRREQNLIINNPYEDDDIYDLVKQVGFFQEPELYPLKSIFVKTENKEKISFGVQTKYFWYGDRYTIPAMATIILTNILEHTKTVHIKTKLHKHYKEAVDRLKLSKEETDSLLKDIIKHKNNITKMSN